MVYLMGLELLSKDEMELAASVGRTAEDFVKAVCPVNTEQTDHRQINTDTGTGRAFQVERVEVFNLAPGITALQEDKAEDIGAIAKDEGITELQRETIVGITGVATGRERTVVVTAQTYGFGGIAVTVTAHTVTTDIEGLER